MNKGDHLIIPKKCCTLWSLGRWSRIPPGTTSFGVVERPVRGYRPKAGIDRVYGALPCHSTSVRVKMKQGGLNVMLGHRNIWLLFGALPVGLLVRLPWVGASGWVLPWTTAWGVFYPLILCIIECFCTTFFTHQFIFKAIHQCLCTFNSFLRDKKIIVTAQEMSQLLLLFPCKLLQFHFPLFISLLISETTTTKKKEKEKKKGKDMAPGMEEDGWGSMCGNEDAARLTLVSI